MNGFTPRLLALEDRCTPATLTGTAFTDANFNGTLDSGETLLANVDVTLNLDGKGTSILSTSTNASGAYTFTGVANGVHTLSGTLAGFSKVTANPVGVNVNTTGSITVNLGFAAAAVVSGFAFSDTDGDGNLDTGERLLPNYTVTLDLGSNGTVDANTFTDANGVYRFSGVANGTHKLTIPNATIAPGSRSVVVTGGSDVSGLGFAITPTGKLEGIAFNDANGTGVLDIGETGLSGTTVNIDFFNDGSIDKTAVTPAGGNYSFTGIPDGTHLVTAQRSGYFNVTPGSFITTWLLGNILQPPALPGPQLPRTPGDFVTPPPQVPTAFALAQSAILSGYVYGDTNASGTPNASEPDLANVTVRLDTDSNGSFDRTTFTDAFGRYAFVNVPNGTHALNVIAPAGFTATAATLTKAITIAAAANSTAIAFPLTTVAPSSVIAVAADSSLINQVRVFNNAGVQISTFAPFAAVGDTRVATGDVNGDGVEDFAVATGPGRTTQVRVLNGANGDELFTINPYGTGFSGGAFVALGDLNGDKRADLVITPDVTGGPRARIFNGNGFTQIADFFGIDDVNFRGGARATIGDLNNDGTGDLAISAGFGGGPRIALFDGKQLTLTGGPKFIGDFFAFEPDLRNGAFLAIGDTNGDGFADLIAGAGQGGAPRVTVFSGKDLVLNVQTRLADFFAAGQIGDRSGARVSTADVDADGKADLIVGYRPVPTFVPRMAAYSGASLSPTQNPTATFDIEPFPGFLGGISVG